MFADNYASARTNFIRLAGVDVESLPFELQGPAGETLAIDIAWLGERTAANVLLVTSGIHGVEGFSGSAVQCAFLAAKPALPHDAAIVLVHALNPWGFAYLRRFNARNVDLNRNFLLDDKSYVGAPAQYHALNSLLNPQSAPARDGFYLRAIAKIVRHGMATLRAGIASGQYEYPHGLFYGGTRLEPDARRFLAWLQASLANARRVVTIDFHSGIGPFGAMTVFASKRMGNDRAARIGRLLGEHVVCVAESQESGGYDTRGSLDEGLSLALGHVRADYLAVEFGTYSGVKMLHALREENRWHHYGDGSIEHPAKHRLLEAFCPASASWRDAVVTRGTRLLKRAVDVLMLE
jgi:hypothetical protein